MNYKITFLFLFLITFSGCSLFDRQPNIAVSTFDGVLRSPNGEIILGLNNNSLITQNYLVDENNKGNIFTIEQYYPNVGSNQNRTIHFKTNGKRVQLLEYAITTEDAPNDIILYEDPNVTSLGNQIEPINKNRFLDTNSTVEVYEGPTLNNAGKLLDRDLLVAGKDTGGQVRRVPYSWILKENTSYILVNRNRGGVEEIIFNLIWHEIDK